MIHDARKRGSDRVRFVERMTQDALKGGLGADYRKAHDDLAAAVAAGSMMDAQEAVRFCLLSYLRAQSYLGAVSAHLGVDLDVIEAVGEWLTLDRDCLMRLRELTTAPNLKELQHIAGDMVPADATRAWRDPF